MASITKRPNGHRWVQFKAPDGRRRTVRLGKVTNGQAHDVRRRIETILAASLANHSLDHSTAEWLGTLPRDLYDKLAAAGLTEARPSGSISELIDYALSMVRGKPSTIKKYENTKANLIAHFGPDRHISTITPADAEEFRFYLLTKGGRQRKDQGLAETTAQKRLNIASGIFKTAIKKRWLTVNPFDDVSIHNAQLIEREFFVDADLTYRILDACKDADFRLLFAMVRFGALRCPSEVLPFRWSWIDWDAATMTVRSPKTEHLPGRSSRVTPIFAELRPYVEAAWAALPRGADDLMFASMQGVTGTALTNRLRKVCRRIGVELWAKPWVNIRSTRETELVDHFPIKSACEWTGNTEIVARRHYLQVTKEHHAKAVAAGAGASRPRKRRSKNPKHDSYHSKGV